MILGPCAKVGNSPHAPEAQFAPRRHEGTCDFSDALQVLMLFGGVNPEEPGTQRWRHQVPNAVIMHSVQDLQPSLWSRSWPLQRGVTQAPTSRGVGAIDDMGSVVSVRIILSFCCTLTIRND